MAEEGTLVAATARLDRLLRDKRAAFITLAELATTIGKSHRHAWHLVTTGRIGPAVQLAREWLVPKSAAMRYLAGKEGATPGADTIVREVEAIIAAHRADLMTVSEVATALNVSARRAGFLVTHKVLGPCVLVGREWLVPRASVTRDKLRPSGRSAFNVPGIERYFTVPQAAKELGLSRQATWNLVKAGTLGPEVGSVYIEDGGVWLLPKESVAALVALRRLDLSGVPPRHGQAFGAVAHAPWQPTATPAD